MELRAKETIEDCDVIVERHDAPRPLPIIDPISGVIHSDERLRIWRVFDIGHTPEKGKDMVRVDIFAAPTARPTAGLGEDGERLSISREQFETAYREWREQLVEDEVDYVPHPPMSADDLFQRCRAVLSRSGH